MNGMDPQVIIGILAVIAVVQLGVLVVLLRRHGASGETEQEIRQLRQDLSDKLSERIDSNQKMMVAAIQEQSSQSNRIIASITKQLTEIGASNSRVVSVADELKTLQNVLQNPKQRGVVGEYHLRSILENVLPPELFALQHKFRNGDTVDAVIFMDKKKMLPVDSKFSLENYNRLVEAKDPVLHENLVKLFKTDLKNRIDETAKYIRPSENTMDFAFMFIPSEAIYYDLLINKVGTSGTSARDLIEYATRDKKVIIVGPNTFMALLQTVLQGLRSLQIEERAKEIQIAVGQLGRHLVTYDEYMNRLGKSLGASVGYFNTAHQELKKVDKDVVKIASTAPVVEPLLLDKPEE